jgi:hypothetical protein
MIPEETREEIFRQLAGLRLALCDLSQHDQALENFDDFVEHHEFEIALHSACDRLLDSGLSVSDETLGFVSQLHRLMKLDDDCAARLSRQASNSGVS